MMERESKKYTRPVRVWVDNYAGYGVYAACDCAGSKKGVPINWDASKI